MDITFRTALKHELINIYRNEGIDVNKDNLIRNIKSNFQDIGKNRIIWFSEVDDKIVGSVQLVLDGSDKNMANGRDIAMIHHLRVAKEFENKGIASKLSRVLEATAKEKNIKRLTLEVEKGNKKAKEIYKHWGYKFLRKGKDFKEIVLYKIIS